jgi:hypothetical protein
MNNACASYTVTNRDVYTGLTHNTHKMRLQRGQILQNIQGELIEAHTNRRIFLRGANVPAKLYPFKHHLTPPALKSLRSDFGFTAIRLVVTWEALEPREQQYDTNYMAYILETVKTCADNGLAVIIDPHQDCWSTWTGGDGAPGWTLERLGFVLDNLKRCCATHPQQRGQHPLLWSTNYQLFAPATMFTLFFGSKRFAKNVRIDNLDAQEWLQGRFIEAFAQLAMVLKAERNVIGFGTLNEPSLGWIGHRDLRHMGTTRRFGYGLSPMQCIRLAAGESLYGVVHYGYPYIPTGIHTLNKECARLMAYGHQDIWPHDIKPDHFALDDQDEDAETLFLHPFWKRFGDRIREAGGNDLLIFTEVPPLSDGNGTKPRPPPNRPPYEIRTPHFYDSVIMGLHRYVPWFALDNSTGWPAIGTDAAAKARHNSVAALRRQGGVALGEVGACWLGESTDAAFDATFRAVESNLMSAAFVWCYMPNHATDDEWNGENFSIWSQNQPRVKAAIRPYALRVAGRPLRMEYDGRRFMLQFQSLECDIETTFETILFKTDRGCVIDVSDGEYDSVERNIIRYRHTPTIKGSMHTVEMRFQT